MDKSRAKLQANMLRARSLTNRQLEHANQRVLAYFDRGVEVLASLPAMGTSAYGRKQCYGKGVITNLAGKHQFGNEDDVSKVLQFVSGRGKNGRGVTHRDIEYLDKRALESGHLLRVTSLRRLLSVAGNEKRYELAKEMVDQCWKQPDVKVAVKSFTPRAKHIDR